MTDNFILKQRMVRRLKATDAGNGRPMTCDAIAREMGLSTGKSAHYYAGDMKGRCPCCCRPLVKITARKEIKL